MTAALTAKSFGQEPIAQQVARRILSSGTEHGYCVDVDDGRSNTTMRSYSRAAEDMFVLFHLKEGLEDLRGRGVYLEIGALDGIRFSNTLLFHKSFGWTGHLIEPSLQQFTKLQANRPDDQLWNKLVAADFGTATWLEREDAGAAVSGIKEHMSPAFLEKWHGPGRVSSQRVREIVPMKSFVNSATTPIIDFFSLDTEGSELEVLKGFDWDIQVHMLLVETLSKEMQLYDSNEIAAFLLDRGFTKVGPIAHNVLYRNTNYTARR